MTKLLDFEQLSNHETPEESPGFLLWRVSTLWRRKIELVLKTLDLTHPQFVILACVGWLTRTGAMVNQLDISRQAGLDPNTTSQILRGLQAKGLVHRARSRDERSKHPTLTETGAKKLSEALPAVEQADAEFFAILEPIDPKFLENLRKLSVTS